MQATETIIQAREEVFDKAGKRNAEELSALMDRVRHHLQAEHHRGPMLPTIDEMQEHYHEKEPIRQGEVLYIPKHSGDLVVLGDIHGDFAALHYILEERQFLEKMQEPERPMKLVLLGDLIDRGAKSPEVVEAIFALKGLYPENVHVIQGDHEMPRVGGRALKRHTEKLQDPTLFEKYYEIFEKLPKFISCGNRVVCVHGGPDLAHRNLQELAGITDPTLAKYVFKGMLTWSDLLDEKMKQKAEEQKADDMRMYRMYLAAEKNETEYEGTTIDEDVRASLFKEYQAYAIQIPLALALLDEEGVYPNGTRETRRRALAGVFSYDEAAVLRSLTALRATVLVRGHQPKQVGIRYDGKLATVHTTGDGSPDAGSSMQTIKNPQYALFPLDEDVETIMSEHLKAVWATAS